MNVYPNRRKQPVLIPENNILPVKAQHQSVSSSIFSSLHLRSLSVQKQVGKLNGNTALTCRVSSVYFHCPVSRLGSDYRRKMESIMEPFWIPAFGFFLSVLILCWKPPDQGRVGCSPVGMFPESKGIKKDCSKIC